MNFLRRLLLFIFSLLTLSLLGFLVTFWEFKNIVFCVFFIINAFVWLYPDKIILGYLGAKEINQSDNENLYQIIKNIIFRRNILVPKIYILTNFRCCDFVLLARNEQTLVLSSNSILYADNGKLKDDLEKILINKKIPWGLITNGLAIIIIFIRICEFISNIFSFNNLKIKTSILYLNLWIIFPLIFFVLKVISPKQHMDEVLKSFIDFMFYNLNSTKQHDREISNQLIGNIYSIITSFAKMRVV